MSAQFILASGSPRRKQLLTQLGLVFDIVVSDIDETPHAEEVPKDYVERLATEKAHSVAASQADNAIVLAADTTVVLEGNILGKPESKEHGLEMLMQLGGTRHQVLTGVCVTRLLEKPAVENNSSENSFSEKRVSESRTISVETDVWFRSLSRREALWYWDTGEPQDKAGSYGLQGIGAAFVQSLTGSYSNVIGLPLSETIDLLRDFGIPCLMYEEAGDDKEFKADVRQSNG